ncbi:MAG: CBS domain-containing protein [Candidatus Hodarchaeota archaeon]
MKRPDLDDEAVIVGPDDPLEKAIESLAIGSNMMALYILEEKKPVGVLVKDDVLTRAVIPGKDLSKMKVKDIMTTNLEVIPEDMDFNDMMDNFFKKGYISQPVVSKDEGTLMGVLTVFDIAQHLFLETKL